MFLILDVVAAEPIFSDLFELPQDDRPTSTDDDVINDQWSRDLP